MEPGDSEAGEAASGPSPISRTRYLAAALPLLFIQYALVVRLRYGSGGLNWLDNVSFERSALATGVVIFACTAAMAWLSVRRAATVGASELTATLSVVPWFQLLAIPALALPADASDQQSPRRYAALRGALWGLAIALGAELGLTLIFGAFGLALFVGSPFLVGFASAYIAEREGDPHPLGTAQAALLLASAVLFGFAFEGLFCLVIIYPLAAIATAVGSLLGMLLARARAKRTAALSSAALLPLLLVAETAGPPAAQFHDVRSIEVSAPAEAVWQSVVHMNAIKGAPRMPFRWGLAYPVAGHIEGTGVGAVRRGVFSTGVAYERVTRWEPRHALWFDVLSDPPMMRETNPFGPVRSAHLQGYFATKTARFTLTPLSNGHTQLTLATDHSLAIGPSSYFLPLARWAVSENKRRVLAHFRDQAEADAGRR